MSEQEANAEGREQAETPPTSGESAAKPPVPAKEEGPKPIGIDHFAEVVLKAGVVRECEPHPNADRLLVMKVDIGEETPRQIVAGIRSDWEPEALIGRTIVIVANLKPAKLRGVESQGMILALKGEEKVIPLGVDGPVKPGTRVT